MPKLNCTKQKMTKIGMTKSFDLGDGKTITLETGKLATQAHGSVVVRCGDAMLLATVVSSKDAKPGIDFLPLSVDYQEKYAGAGRFPGGFLRREGRLSDYEILISRLVDRALRPMFPDDYHADIQVMITLLSADKDVMPDALAGLAASAAITLSNIPFNGPISEVRVGRIDGKFVVNPGVAELKRADMDMLVAASERDILMMEGEMKECSEQDMIEAIKIAHEAIRVQIRAQLELADIVGIKPKREYSHETHNEELKAQVKAATYYRAYEVAKAGLNKDERAEAFRAVIKDFILANFGEKPEDESLVSLSKKYYHDVEKEAVRNLVLDEGKRLDGRKVNEIRPIWAETNYLPSAHGSAVFTRGETQSLTTVTLGGRDDEQLIDGAMFFGDSRFLLHYNFPGFSTGEVRPNRGAGRREIGHGNLALRALKNVLPEGEKNPYTIRIVSDILESNGSSSMATVCAATLALMDSGIQITAPVSGIAMGLITDSKTGKWAVLSDILGDEDHLGDMDFKVTGTRDGICGVQMDIKVDGLSMDIMRSALAQARKGRLHILDAMHATIEAARADVKPHAPRMIKFTIDKEYIGAVIGPGGKVIQEIQRETGATVNIEEVNNAGSVSIFCKDKVALDKAYSWIQGLVATAVVGETYEGTIKSIKEFGAFVEFLPKKEGLLHISEISWKRLETMDGIFTEGEKVKVKLMEIDQRTGKFKLSRKALMPKPEAPARPEAPKS